MPDIRIYCSPWSKILSVNEETRDSINQPQIKHPSSVRLFQHIERSVKFLSKLTSVILPSAGAETGWTDLTALAVVSIQLFDKDGSAIQVSDPIHISVPLPSDTRNRMATSVPAWLYQPKTGEGNTEIILTVMLLG